MPYTPNPADPSEPIDSVMAGTAAAEFRALKTYLLGLANAERNLRLPSGETFTEMAAKANWVNKILGFNSSGNPIPVLPGTGTASDVLIWLADAVDAAAGAGAIGLGHGIYTIPGTVGYALTNTGRKNARIDYNCKFDGATDDTVNLQAAVTDCENNGYSLEMPNGTVVLSGTIIQTKPLHLYGQLRGATVLKSSAAVAYKVQVAAGTAVRYSHWHDFSIEPAVDGTGTNGFVVQLASDHSISGNPALPDTFCYMSNCVMERVRIGDFGGFGMVWDNAVANLNSFFVNGVRNNWITNGMALNITGDSNEIGPGNTITDGPTVQAAKSGGRVGISYVGIQGARLVNIHDNNITTSAGFINCYNCEQVMIEKNQCEQPVYYDIPYYANDPSGVTLKGAGIYLFNSYAASLVRNTCGAGSITTRTATGTTTNGSPTVPGVSVMTGLHIGCTVQGVGIPVSTRILNIVGTTITLTKNATANGTPTLTFGYSPDSSIFLDGGTINTCFDTNNVTSGTYFHYLIASGCYDNNTTGNSTYAGVSLSAVVSDLNLTNNAYNSIEDPLSKYPRDERLVNSFLDLVNNNPINTWPVNFAPPGGSTVTNRDTVTPYAGNRLGISIVCVSAGATIDNGVVITPAQQPMLEDGWASGLIAVKANNTTNGRIIVFGLGGTTPVLQVGITTIAGAYQLIPYRFRVLAGATWGIKLAIGNGAGAYSNGFGYSIGAVSIVNGPHIPTNFQENTGARRKFRHSGAARLAYTPPFAGAELYDSVANKMYCAFDSTAPAGWGAGWTP